MSTPPRHLETREHAAGSAKARLPRRGDIIEGRYEVELIVGSGGMATVFAARHMGLKRRVALKVLAPELAQDEAHTDRFIREARAVSALRHPCIVEILDFGHVESGSPFFAMEYLEGENLAELLQRRGPLPWSELGPIALQVCGALHEAHRASMIHRDIKPENLFLLDDGAVKVLDFGIAKLLSGEQPRELTDTGAVIGTVDYLSPEAIRSQPVDPRTDIYSLGVTLYQLLCGELPFSSQSRSRVETMMAHLDATPEPLPEHIDPAVAAVLMRCLEKQPSERFASAHELFMAIRALLPAHAPEVLEAVAQAKLSKSSSSLLGLSEQEVIGHPRNATHMGHAMTAVSDSTQLPTPPPRADVSELETTSASRIALHVQEPAATVTGPRRRWMLAAGLVVLVLVLVIIALSIAEQRRLENIDPQHLASFGALPDVILGPGVELTEAKVELGRRLFAERRLSGAGDLACVDCHPLERYGVDGLPVARGHARQTTGRNVPTVYNAAGHFALGWTGAAATIEAQARIPILEPREMNSTEEQLVAALAADPAYRASFAAVFPDDDAPISLDNVAAALAAFERTLVTPAPWDAYLGGELGVLDEAQRRGFNTFIEVGCVQCHSGIYLGGTQLQKLGLLRPWPDSKDRGRYEDTQQDADWMSFKVASLRNVSETGPYFHDGSIASLETAVRMMAHHQLDTELYEGEVEDIVAFLGALTGTLDAAAGSAPAP